MPILTRKDRLSELRERLLDIGRRRTNRTVLGALASIPSGLSVPWLLLGAILNLAVATLALNYVVYGRLPSTEGLLQRLPGSQRLIGFLRRDTSSSSYPNTHPDPRFSGWKVNPEEVISSTAIQPRQMTVAHPETTVQVRALRGRW